MGYKTVYIRESEKLRLYLDNLLVETKDGEIKFLINDLKYLIIDNYKAILSTQLINRLSENNVSLVLCDLSHHPYTQLIPINGHYASSGMLKKQIKWDDDLKSKIHKEIIKNKILSEVFVLKKNDRNKKVIEKLLEFKEEVIDNDSTNREGLAAKMYFRELFGNDFIRFDTDIINAGLDYGYSIFRSLIESIVVSKGLNPNLGIFHKSTTNSFNLADDIIEIYRPIVDDYVFNNMMNEELLTEKHRENLIKLVDLKVEILNQKHLINNSIEMYVESIIKCFDENSINYLNIPKLI